jgi:hypothetical protein
MSTPLKLLLTLSLLCIPVASSSYVGTPEIEASENHLNPGYSTLKLFLNDEQHLTTIRRIKAVMALGGISEPSIKLIDNIADLSTTALEELEALAPLKPSIGFVEFSDELIGKATLDSLRMTAAKEFLFDNDNFEKNLLISQAQVLRVISHLAAELAEKESSVKRKAWLNQLAKKYENLYVLVYERIALT